MLCCPPYVSVHEFSTLILHTDRDSIAQPPQEAEAEFGKDDKLNFYEGTGYFAKEHDAIGDDYATKEQLLYDARDDDYHDERTYLEAMRPGNIKH